MASPAPRRGGGVRSLAAAPRPTASATLVAAASVIIGFLLLPLPVPDDPLTLPNRYAPRGVPMLVAEYDQLRAAGATTEQFREALALSIVPLALGVRPPPGAAGSVGGDGGGASSSPSSSSSSSSPPSITAAAAAAAAVAALAMPLPPPPAEDVSARGAFSLRDDARRRRAAALAAGVAAFASAVAAELDRPHALTRCPLWDASLPRPLRPPLRASVLGGAAGVGRNATLPSEALWREEQGRREQGRRGGRRRRGAPPERPPSFVLASNQFNSEAVMPNFIAQVMHLALGNEAVLDPSAAAAPRRGGRAGASGKKDEEGAEDDDDDGSNADANTRRAGHPLMSAPGQLRVSIYESGSSDSTPQWLELLELLLEAAGVPSRVVAGGALGKRRPGSDRIAFLAHVRNAALAVLARPAFPAGASAAAGDALAAEEAEAALIARRVGGFSPLRRRRRLQASAASAGLAATGGEDDDNAAAARAGTGSYAKKKNTHKIKEEDERKRKKRRQRAEAAKLAGGGGREGARDAQGDDDDDDADGASGRDARLEDARDRPPLASTTPWADGVKGRLGRADQDDAAVAAPGTAADADADADADAGATSAASASTAGWRPDYLVFVNDVFFCAQDVARLASHRADAACGLDTSRFWLGAPWATQAFEPPVHFYDFWVSRDADGRRFDAPPPYAPSRASSDALRRGLPFRAQCCWNGLVVLDAAPFLPAGGGGAGGEGGALRFRARVLAPEFEASGTPDLASEEADEARWAEEDKAAGSAGKKDGGGETEEEEEEDDKGGGSNRGSGDSSGDSRRQGGDEDAAAAVAAAAKDGKGGKGGGSNNKGSSNNNNKASSSSSASREVSPRERRRRREARREERRSAQWAASRPPAGECDSSECSLLCDDLTRLGRRDVVVDPGVRVAYFWEVSRALSAGGGDQWRQTTWADVAATENNGAAVGAATGGDADERGSNVSSDPAPSSSGAANDTDDAASSSGSGSGSGSGSASLSRWWGRRRRRRADGRAPPLHWRDLGPQGGSDRSECCPKIGPHFVPFSNCWMEPLDSGAALSAEKDAFVNYTAAAMERWWRVLEAGGGGAAAAGAGGGGGGGRPSPLPVRDGGLGLVEAAAAEAEEEARQQGVGEAGP